MPETQPQNPPLMLVVDDEKIMQDVMRDILEESGYKVDVASNGKKALEQVRTKNYDLVFADIRMPKIDGMEFLKRARDLTPDLDIVMMTGYASVDIAVEAIKLGAQDFITKPFDFEHIRIVAARAIERKSLKKQVEEGEYYKKISLTDGLTELYNHRHFHQLLHTEMSRSERKGRKFCLLMIDVDDFKIYNDTLGHPAGDEALRFLAWLLKHHARISDIGEGKIAAERFRRIVEKSEFDQQDVMPGKNLTVSIGMACYPDDGESSDEILRRADQALYRAKRDGKNRVVTWAEMRRDSARAK
jgi:two-component system cell cycle response regulator